MKYMLLMQFGAQSDLAPMHTWAPEEVTAHLDFMKEFHAELTEEGELVGGEGLADPGQARTVRAGSNGAPVVTDGPYPETKEFLMGYWIVDCETEQRAHELAARASAAPGPGGRPANMPIEVRQVMSAPPADL
ncbi:YciI family protein [Streptomonospora halophila]|uniref:YciI family protein n=1 Tax=Streptomonospora halophila TaxID=427369 RepID=A0ABP9GQ01_9ACTN